MSTQFVHLDALADGSNVRLAEDPNGVVRERRKVVLLPDPEPRERTYTVFSVDDHLVEPPDAFEGRVPAKFRDRAPRVVTTENGGEAWVYDGHVLPQVGFNAVAGRPPKEMGWEPTRFDEMRRGAWDAAARVKDMDINGDYASVCFPSHITGFAGGRLQTLVKDQDLALATLRAYNEWNLEGWAGANPQRLVPLQVAWLHDPVVGAKEIERNAARGFHAVSFPEAPDRLGFPTVYSDYWDPIIAACADTGTAMCLHVGSSGMLGTGTPGAPSDTSWVLFAMSAMMTALDWVYAGWAVRYPTLKVVLSEGGVGWVAGVMDRMERGGRDGMHLLRGDYDQTWLKWGVMPVDVFRRNFWFSFIDDPSTIKLRHEIGIDHVMFEVDYPHADTTWPDSQALLRSQLAGLPADEVAVVTWRNASALFQHPIPKAVQRDPNAY